MSLIDSIRQQLGPNEIQHISQQLGVDPATTEQAVHNALPSMLAGMDSDGAAAAGTHDIQTAMGAGGILGGLGSILGGAGGGDLGGMLGSILGRNNDTVHADVQQKSGLDSAKTRQLLMMLAPVVLAALARRRSQPHAGGDAPNPANVPGTQAKHDGGLLGKILDHVQEPRS